MRFFPRPLQLCLILLLIPTGIMSAAPHSIPELVISSGDVDQTSAVLWARTPALGIIRFEVWEDVPLGLTDLVGTHEDRVSDAMRPVKFEITGLEAGKRYFYQVVDRGGAIRTGIFVTPSVVGSYSGLRFGVTGDWRGDLAPYLSLRNVLDRNLDLFVLLGDTIYADYPSPDLNSRQAYTVAEFRVKHAEPLSRRLGLNFWAEVRASTALLAMIDDHEVTNDFSGGALPSTDRRFGRQGTFINETDLYRNGLQAFTEWMPIRAETFTGTGDPRSEAKPRLYRYRHYGSDAAFFLLDARSFRDAALPPFEPTDLLNPLRVATAKIAAFESGRTMLGAAQLTQLKTDLLAAHQAGITWKFILVPQPIQNFGTLGAGDRFEGYAAERSALLEFITQAGIKNVVFIAADFHGTFVNNLTYQTCAACPLLPTSMWEIVTGSVAFDAPAGDSFALILEHYGVISTTMRQTYQRLPVAIKDALLTSMLNLLLRAQGYDLLGFDTLDNRVRVLKGGAVAANTYGWTEFEIDPVSQRLTVTTYGILPYSAADLDQHFDQIIGRVPEVISQFEVQADF